MGQLALANERWSVLTIGEQGASRPWQALFGWPAHGDADLPVDARSRNIWAARLDDLVTTQRNPVMLLASGAGCHAAAWWARLSPRDYVDRIAGAMFFAPPQSAGFESPSTRLPFPSILIGAGHDDGARALANAWGSRIRDAHRARRPHANAWRHAQRLVSGLAARVVEHDVETVSRLYGIDGGADRS